MPWYYYSGQKPVAIPVGDGEVRSVRPHTKVEIHPSSANDVQIRTLSRMGVLRQCGKPQNAPVVGSVEDGDTSPPKSGQGEPFKFHEFLTKEGGTRKGRPSPEESIAPVDRPESKKEEAGADAEKVADDADGGVQEGGDTEDGSQPKKRTRRRRSTS